MCRGVQLDPAYQNVQVHDNLNCARVKGDANKELWLVQVPLDVSISAVAAALKKYNLILAIILCHFDMQFPLEDSVVWKFNGAKGGIGGVAEIGGKLYLS